MSTVQRVVFLAIAAVIVVVAIVAFGSGGDDKTATVSAVTQTTVASTTSTSTGTTTDKVAAPAPPLLKAGSVKTISVKKGDTVKFQVINPAAEEVHVHGYDFKYELEPGVAKTVSFPAKIEGQFEIELEGSGTQLAKLVVNPQ